MQKPKEVPAQEHIAQVNEINAYLPRFPDVWEGVAATAIEEDEIKDILDFGNPGTWQKQMILQGFDPLEKSMKEFIDFCERLERTKDLSPSTADNQQVQTSKEGKSKKKAWTERNKSSDKYYCHFHGKNRTHGSEDCNTLKKMTEDKKSGSEKKKSKGEKKYT